MSSLASRAKGTLASFTKIKNELSGAVGALKEAYTPASKGQAQNTLDTLMGKLDQTAVPFTRVDEAMVYTNTERRKIDLNFVLVAYEDASKEIIQPIQALQKLTTPLRPDKTSVTILPPCYFSIRSEPATDSGTMIYLDKMIIRSVQYTFRSPYIKGGPSSCDLTLSFEQLTPLYRNDIDYKCKVSTENPASK
jgi:hypothetical protein